MSSALSDITQEGRSEVSGIIILISESGKKVHAHTEELFPSPHSMTLHFLHTPHSPQAVLSIILLSLRIMLRLLSSAGL